MPLDADVAESGVPRRLGRYEIVRPLGSGGMATVYLARTPVVDELYREVAIKIMHPHLRGDPDGIALLLREARLAARVRHRNVVSVDEVVDDPVGIFLVMEHVRGDTLLKLMRADHELPPAIAGRILVDALSGLHAAHELASDDGDKLGLVHRDFSPHNILVGIDGVARLTDFGIAKLLHDSEAQTTTGVAKGKLSYMAPEQLRGRKLDRRCDVWSAGVVAWELAAGRRLHAAPGDVEEVIETTKSGPARLKQVCPSISEAIDRVVSKALAVDAGARWPTALAFRDALAPAWREHFGLAEVEEVSAYVSARCTLEAPVRGEASRVVMTAIEATERSHVLAARPPARRRRIVALVAVGVAAGAAFFTWRAAREPLRAAPNELPAISIEPLVSSPSKREALVVEADAPVAELQIGKRTLVIGQPSKRVEVVLSESEQHGAIEVRARAADGRTARASASGDRVEITFPPIRAVAPRSPQPKAKVPPRGLAPM